MLTRRLRLAPIATLLLACAALPVRAGEVFEIDKTHSTVNFKIRHFVSKFTGRFASCSGTIDLDRANPPASKVEFKIDVNSIDTANGDRDKHLKSPDFFDAEKNPEITFKSTKIADKGSGSFDVLGDLTMRGVTKPVTLSVTHTGFLKDPKGNERAGFEVAGKLNRKDYGVSWNRTLDQGGFMLSDDVDIAIGIEALKKAPAPAPAK